MTIETERDEALAFARSEVKRNADLAYENTRHQNDTRRNFEAVGRVRDRMKERGYSGGSYLGLYYDKQPIGDAKYTPAIEVLEAFINSLLKRLDAE